MAEASCPRISTIIPAYNAAETLPHCLAALAAQRWQRDDFEVIVVDDGSQDETAALARASGARVISQPNAGPAAARNRGAAAARGELLLFTDADCEPTPDWIAQMTAPFADPDVAGVKGSYLTRQPQVVARLAQCEFEERYDRQEQLHAIDFVDSYAAGFRAAVFREAGGFDPAFRSPNHEDADLSYRLAAAGHLLRFNRAAIVHHRHVDTWWGYFRLKITRGYWRMLVIRRHPDKGLRDSYTPQVIKLQLLLVVAVPVLALAAAAWAPAAWGALAGLAALSISALPFAGSVHRRDPRILPWVPLFVATRAAAFALGVAGGAIGMLFFRPTLSAPGRPTPRPGRNDGA